MGVDIDESNVRYYGWLIVALCFVVLFVASGARFAFGVIFDSLLADFGASRSLISLIQSVQFVTYALSVPLIGMLLDRYSAVKVFSAGIVLVAVGYGASGLSPNVWGLFLTLGVLVGLGSAGVSYVTIGVIISRWFYEYRGFATSVANTGFNLGQLTIVPLVGIVLGMAGWETAVMGLGVVTLLILIPTYLVLAGGREHPAESGERGAITQGQLEFSSLRRVLRTRSFLGISVSHFFCGFTDFVVAVHLVSYLTGIGYSTVFGSTALGVLGAASLVGVIATGRLADRLLTKNVIAALHAGRVVAFLLLANLAAFGGLRTVAVYVFVAIFGFGFYATAPLMSTLTADLYGDELMGSVLGWVSGIHFIGAAAGSFFAGWIFDLVGSYWPAFYLSAAFVLVGSVATYVVRERHSRTVDTAAEPA